MAESPRPFGPYVLLKALGRGAMGDVHLARPYNPNRGVPTPVVVKRLHGELAHKKGFVSRFKHEAAIAVSVESPHVARVYDVGSVGETLYIVMEYVAGWPLSKVLDAILKSGRHASIASVVDSIAGGLYGLHALHTARDPQTGKPLGIVHRDISPKNLMIGEDGLMRLIDLGLGKSNAQDWKTRTGVVMGSVGYMPPEQAAGEHVDARADVYAMGVVAFEMLALRNYIKRGNLAQMMELSAHPKFQRPSDFRPDVPPGLDEVIERAVKPDKDERFPTAKAFLDALHQVVSPGQTEGGMASLVEELFGETKKEREREIEALLRLPLPHEDPGEFEPTKVFVQRAGVRLPDERHLEKTRVEPAKFQADGPTVPPTVATEVSWGQATRGALNGSAPHDTTPDVVVVARSTSQAGGRASSNPGSRIPISNPSHAGVSSVPDAAVMPFLTQQIVAPRTPGVSLGVLLASVLVAAIVGAVVAVVVSSTMMKQDASIVSVQPNPSDIADSSPPVTVHAVADSHAKAPKDDAEDASRTAPKTTTPKKHVAKTMHAREPTAALEPEKTAPADPKAVLERRYDDLVRRVAAALEGLPEGAKRSALLDLKARVGMNAHMTDLGLLEKNLDALERELSTLTGG